MRRSSFVLSLVVLTQLGFAESRALLVGVGKHQSLTAVFRLEGCENDLNSMESIVGKLGQGQVAITKLLDERASKAAVLAALGQIAKASKPGDRFVFYFSGHGTLDKERDVMALVPYDAKQGQPDSWLKREEVHGALNAIKGSKVAIIDACHSGGLIGKNLDPNFNTRFVDLSGPSLSKGPGASWRVPPTIVEEAEAYQESAEVQYLMACTVDQQAWEFKRAPSTQKPSGVFTYHLLQRLQNPASQTKTWGALMGEVSADVQTSLAKHEKIQNPVASAAATAAPVAGGTSAAASKPTDPKTLQELFLRSRPNREALKITFPDGANQLPVAGKLPLVVHARQRGFLILLVSQGEEAALMYPQASRGQSVADGFVNSLEPLTKFSIIGRRPGSYQVKAFLFPANGAQDLSVRKSAEEVFDAFNSGRKITDQSKSGLEVAVDDYYTFEWTVEVAEVLFGGRIVATEAIPGLQEKLDSDSDRLGAFLRRVVAEAGIREPLAAVDEPGVIRIFNALSTSSVPLLDEALAKELKVSSGILKPLRSKNETASPEANMNYLAALFPQLFKEKPRGSR